MSKARSLTYLLLNTVLNDTKLLDFNISTS